MTNRLTNKLMFNGVSYTQLPRQVSLLLKASSPGAGLAAPVLERFHCGLCSIKLPDFSAVTGLPYYPIFNISALHRTMLTNVVLSTNDSTSLITPFSRSSLKIWGRSLGDSVAHGFTVEKLTIYSHCFQVSSRLTCKRPSPCIQGEITRFPFTKAMFTRHQRAVFSLCQAKFSSLICFFYQTAQYQR